MRTKDHGHRGSDGDPRDGLDRLYDRLVTWLYERQDLSRALPIANRLEVLLAPFDRKPENIFIEECRSLVCEAKGDLKNAIKHRKHEIRLIRRLHEISRGTESEPYVLSQYSHADLRDRLNLLAMLYRDSGDLKKAVATLLESKRLCEKHGIKFDANDVLKDYMNERGVTQSIGEGLGGQRIKGRSSGKR